MRRSFIALVGAGALVAALVPTAGARIVPVDGNRFNKAGLTALSQGCVDRRATPAEAPTLKIRTGPGNVPIGTHSEGWQTHGPGFGAGWVGRVRTPASLSRMRVQLFSPSQEAHGHAVVYYHPEGDPGYWFGNHSLGVDTKKGWHSVNAAAAEYTWTHYDEADLIDRTAPYATIATHVRNHGGNGDGAQLGFVFGCDENAFFVDKLELRTAHDNRTFDFGGFRTRPRILLGETQPDRAVLLYGYELRIGGTLHERWGGSRVPAVLKFDARPAGGGKWRQVGKDRSGTDSRASTLVKPSRSTVYRVRYDGVERFEASTSETLKIVIRNRVNARLVDATVRKGQLFHVAGVVKPAKTTGILLQRFVNGTWRTVKKGQTGGEGRFRIGAVAGDTGNSYWRIRSRNGGGTVGNVSQNLKLSVSQPSGGGGGGGTDDPEPPPPPPPPPPPEG